MGYNYYQGGSLTHIDCMPQPSKIGEMKMNMQLGTNSALGEAITDAEREQFKDRCNEIKQSSESLSGKVRKYAMMMPMGFNADRCADDLGMQSYRNKIASTMSSFASVGKAEVISHTLPKTYRVFQEVVGHKMRKRPEVKKSQAPLLDELSTVMAEHAILKGVIPTMIKTLTDLGYEVKFKG